MFLLVPCGNFIHHFWDIFTGWVAESSFGTILLQFLNMFHSILEIHIWFSNAFSFTTFFLKFLSMHEKETFMFCVFLYLSCPVSIYLFKVNNKNARKSFEICSKLKIKTPEPPQWRRFTPFSSVSILEYKQKYVCCECVDLRIIVPVGVKRSTK